MTIAIAITNRRLLRFTYGGKVRVVEPHTYGRNRWGQLAVCGYQREAGGQAGETTGWRTFVVDRMEGLTMSPESFEGPRPEYRRGDGLFKEIVAEL